MPINHEYKLCYVHIPKTAGTSITNLFKFKQSGHAKMSEISKPENYLLFTVIRNPWDRFASAFYYSSMKKNFWHDNINKKSPHPDYLTLKDLEFNEAIRKYYNKEIKLMSLHFQPMICYLNDDLSKLDLIIRYENLSEDISTLLKNLGLNKTLEVINSSNRKQDYKLLYEEDTKQMIYELYKNDIETFNYTFEK